MNSSRVNVSIDKKAKKRTRKNKRNGKITTVRGEKISLTKHKNSEKRKEQERFAKELIARKQKRKQSIKSFLVFIKDVVIFLFFISIEIICFILKIMYFILKFIVDLVMFVFKVIKNIILFLKRTIKNFRESKSHSESTSVIFLRKITHIFVKTRTTKLINDIADISARKLLMKLNMNINKSINNELLVSVLKLLMSESIRKVLVNPIKIAKNINTVIRINGFFYKQSILISSSKNKIKAEIEKTNKICMLEWKEYIKLKEYTMDKLLNSDYKPNYKKTYEYIK